MNKLSRKEYFSIALWILPLAVVLSLMLGLHLAPHRVEPLMGLASTEDQLVVHHFLSLRCNCSRNLIRHLSERKAQAGVREVVHLIYSRPEIRLELEAAGYQVLPISEEAAVSLFNLKDLLKTVETNY